MNVYEIILKSHNGLRWIMLALLLFVIARSWSAYAGKKSFGKLDNATGGALVGISHLQLLLGFILYFGLSPITEAAFADFGAAMKDKNLRFYAVEHILTMIIAVGLIQAGRILSKKATDEAQKFKKIHQKKSPTAHLHLKSKVDNILTKNAPGYKSKN